MTRLAVFCMALTIGGSAAAMAADPPSQMKSILEGTNAAQHATKVAAALQEVGYTGVENTTCGGRICEARALWEDKPVKLRIELRTGRIEATAQ
ncbi:MAG: hypothetical protein QNJ30_15280 [Kiloniellales bacterium]|nr:hypothetical protein [Kiloniellales bacterium]